MFNAPAKGVAVDLSLDRGRVEMSGSERTAGAHAVIRFLHEVWEVVLESADSKVRNRAVLTTINRWGRRRCQASAQVRCRKTWRSAPP